MYFFRKIMWMIIMTTIYCRITNKQQPPSRWPPPRRARPPPSPPSPPPRSPSRIKVKTYPKGPRGIFRPTDPEAFHAGINDFYQDTWVCNSQLYFKPIDNLIKCISIGSWMSNIFTNSQLKLGLLFGTCESPWNWTGIKCSNLRWIKKLFPHKCWSSH